MKNPADKRKGFSTIGDSIKDLLHTYKLQGKYDQMHLINYWEDLVGKTIAKRTKKVYFKGSVLVVEVSSAPLRQELNQQKPAMLKLIQEKYGHQLVEELLFI